MNVQKTVLDRYSKGAKEVQPALCCPVDYDAGLLAMLPKEIVDKDYGCGDPSRYVRKGDVVLDLGSGSGKICYMAAQLVGPSGFVIGVDMNDDMLALAGKYQAEMADKLGGQRVRFVKGHIQDLALDLHALDDYLAAHPVRTHDDLNTLRAWEDTQRRERPLIADHSVDLVISNCVLNLVDEADKRQLVSEIYRVLKPGGRIYVFEHNPRNPLVRYVIARTPIDENAILLDAREVRHGLLDAARYELETDYLMFMPPGIAFLAPVDRTLAWLPLGAQYVVAARKAA